jgi:hypothetical protein
VFLLILSKPPHSSRLVYRCDLCGEYVTPHSGDDGTRLFCSYPCGLAFGVACWNANMRIKREK